MTIEYTQFEYILFHRALSRICQVWERACILAIKGLNLPLLISSWKVYQNCASIARTVSCLQVQRIDIFCEILNTDTSSIYYKVKSRLKRKTLAFTSHAYHYYVQRLNALIFPKHFNHCTAECCLLWTRNWNITKRSILYLRFIDNLY